MRSREAVLRVTPDATPPRFIAAEMVEGSNDRVRVVFSEPLAPDCATPTHFAITGGVTVRGVRLGPGGAIAVLATSSVDSGKAPRLSVRNLRDRSAAGNTLPQADTPIAPHGTGLQAEYFDDLRFRGAVVRRVDANIDFNWGQSAPAPGIGPETWSARWTGFLRAPVTGDYAFRTLSDDGMRLWVAGQLVVDSWHDQSAREPVGGSSIHLDAGRDYAIRIEFYDNTYSAVARLFWTEPGGPERIVPGNCLFVAAGR
jgi:hypothetical protein